MAQHTDYHQDLDVADGIASPESIGVSPSSEFVPIFGAGARSSTWPMSRYESFEAAFGYFGEHYENDDENDDRYESEEAEPKASISGALGPLIFEAIEPPIEYTPLTFRPKYLKRRVLLPMIAFYASMLGLLGYLIQRSLSERVWTIRNVNYFLAARYLPAVIGTCTNSLFSSTASTLRRILPFIHLADQKNATNKYRIEHTICARYFPLSKKSNWTIWLLNFGNFTIGFTIAAKATLLATEETESGVWQVSVRQASAVYLVFMYLIITSISVFIVIRYASANTGLKKDWGPTSLADIILLFAPIDKAPNLNHGLNSTRWYRMLRDSRAKFRLGYWKVTDQTSSTSSIIYGIQEVGAVSSINDTKHLRRFNDYMDENGSLSSCCRHLDHSKRFSGQSSPRPFRTESQGSTCRCQNHPHCSHYPYVKAPFVQGSFWCLVQITLLVAILVCLSIALIRMWYCEGTVLNTGLWIIQSDDAPSATNDTRSATQESEVAAISDIFNRHDKAAATRYALADLLFRVLPIVFVGWVGASMVAMDIHHRWVQPFTNMYEKASLASESLLLDYLTISPLSVIPQAWANEHYRVVCFGVLSALKRYPPLIMTALCAINDTGSGIVVQLSPTVACFMVLWSSICIYALILAWSSAERRLPRDVGSLYDYLCFFYDSQLRWFPEFGRAAFSKDITKDELHSMLRLARDEFRFGLVGDPQNQHPGFDVAEHVTWVVPVPGICQRIKNLFRRRKSTSDSSDNGSDSASEGDALRLDDLDDTRSAHHRGS